MLLGDFAAAAQGAGVELSVGQLQDRDGSPAAARLRERGIEPALVRIQSLLRPRDLRQVRRHLAAVAPDVLHTQLGYADYLGGLAARSLGLPAVSTLHTAIWGDTTRDRVKTRLMAFARRHCAARVITVSDSLRAWYLEGGWDRPEHVITVRNGIAAVPRPGAGRAIRASLGLLEDDLVLAMNTVLRPGKGHDVAAAAVARLRDRFPGLRLLVLGDGPAWHDVERAMAPLGRAAVMTGHRDDVMAVLDAVDVLVHPSSVDAFPAALLEAMAAGVPIAATAVGGIPEIVQDGREAALIEPLPTAERLAAALAPLLDEPERRRHLAARARDRFEREFTADRWAGRLVPVYEAALARGPAPAPAPRPSW